LIGAGEGVAIGLRIAGDLNAMFGSDGTRLIGKRGLLQSLHVQLFESKDGDEHVQVQVGNDAALRHGGMPGEIARA
jgi:hypothetical protein